jgi:chemotaxis protein histidine kinase CheA
MDKELFQLFVEEFNESFDQYVTNAQKISNSKNPENELRQIKETIHNLQKSCEILGIDNLRDFFRALEAVFNKVSFKRRKNVSQLLDQSLGIGFFKFQEISKKISTGNDLHDVEVLVDVENLYQIAQSNNL